MSKPITAWSYSRLSCYESCPLLYKYRNIDKLDEPKAPAMWRGIKIHNEAAKFLEGKTDVFPESCVNFKDQFYELRELTPIVEQKWAFTKQMRSTGYFAKDCWLRATADVALIYSDGWGEVIDHKTGKKYDDYEDQVNLFAGTLIKMHPAAITEGVTVRLWFLDIDDDTENEVVRDIPRDEALEMFDQICVRGQAMIDATRFPPRASWKCGGVKKDGTVWGCHFRASNGGPCEFG